MTCRQGQLTEALVQDEMLPPAQMQELYTIAKQAGAKNVTWVDFADAHHMGNLLTTFLQYADRPSHCLAGLPSYKKAFFSAASPLELAASQRA